MSPTEQAEFVNFQGLFVWEKSTHSLQITNPSSFWCGGTENINPGGVALFGCNSEGEETHTLGDPQVGYDASLGRWVISEMEFDVTNTVPPQTKSPPHVFFAASTTNSAAGPWIRWNTSVCTTDSAFPFADQPLLGWSGDPKNGVVAIDVKCLNSAVTQAGEDNLFVVPNSTITSEASALPGAVQPPCGFMAPARDQTAKFASVYLVGSVVPNTDTKGITALDMLYPQQLKTCGVNSANTTPYVVEYTANTSGVFGANESKCPSGSVSNGSPCAPAATSPQIASSLPLTYFPPSGAGQLCPAGASAGTPGCPLLNPNNARITQSRIQLTNVPGGTGADPYLTTAFAANQIVMNNPSSSVGATSFGFIQDINTESWTTLDGSLFWYTYPTIAMDGDGEIYFAVTQFTPSIFPATRWWAYKLINSGAAFLGNGTIETGGGTYTGDGTGGIQRWGDYQTMVFDPNSSPKSPSGEAGAFWQIEEHTNGAADEGSTWVPLADPLPYYFGSQFFESECPNGSGTCSITVSAPAGAQTGDVLLVPLLSGGMFTPSPPTVPAGWSVLPIAGVGAVCTPNNGPNNCIVAEDSCGFGETGWLLGYVVGSVPDDTHSYSFSQTELGFDTCGPSLAGELEAISVDYRGASSNLSKYAVSGTTLFGDAGSFSTGPIAVTPESTLLTIFNGPVGSEPMTQPDFGDIPGNFTAITGSPTMTAETPLTNVIDFLAGDVTVPPSASGNFGPYSTGVAGTGGCNAQPTPAGCLWFSLQVTIPE